MRRILDRAIARALAVATLAIPRYAGAQTPPAAATTTGPAPAPATELPAAPVAGPDASSTQTAPAAAEPAPPASAGPPSPAAPLAGNYGGIFYLRDPDDNFRLYPQAVVQVDSYNYFGRGVSDTGLKSTISFCRLQLGLSGEFLQRWQWMLTGNWGQTAIDNAAGTNETFAAPAAAAPTAANGQYASAQTASVKAAVTNAYVSFRADPLFNIRAGQYNAPFTLENRTSDNYTQFMERPLAIRDLGIPTNKEMGLMAWGETADKMFFYAVGVFDGDGQNRGNVDNRFDGMGSVVVRPLEGEKGAHKNAQIGAGVRYGVRDSGYVNYDYPSMTTQGSWAFWSPIYVGTAGRVHVIPSGSQLGLAAELRVPVEDVDVTGELVSINNQTREGMEGAPANTLRRGHMRGYSYYAQIGYWALGSRDVLGIPGGYASTHVDFGKPYPATPPQALEFLVKWEQLHATYDSADREGAADTKGIDGDVKVNAFSLGVNYWATKHVRLTANWVYDMFPGSAPASASVAGGPTWSSSQRAQAPANKLVKGINDSARDEAHAVQELLFRVAVAF